MWTVVGSVFTYPPNRFSPTPSIIRSSLSWKSVRRYNVVLDFLPRKVCCPINTYPTNQLTDIMRPNLPIGKMVGSYWLVILLSSGVICLRLRLAQGPTPVGPWGPRCYACRTPLTSPFQLYDRAFFIIVQFHSTHLDDPPESRVFTLDLTSRSISSLSTLGSDSPSSKFEPIASALQLQPNICDP